MIRTEKLDEQTYRFHLGKQISESTMDLKSPQEALNSPVGKKLFGFPWTESLHIGTDFLDVQKKEWVDWDILLEPLQGLLEEHFSQTSLLEKAALPSKTDVSSDEAAQIKEYIESSINPSLAMHGGFVSLQSFENKTAYLSMGGGCQGCASSQATMVEGIETALKERFNFVDRVVDMTDHAAGLTPFY